MVPEHAASGRAQLSISAWGEQGPAILALHPGVADSRVWQWCAPTWAQAGYRVIAYDRRGFGSTQYEAEEHDDLADLLAVTKATDSTPAVVIGNSKGGGLALDLTLAKPDEVDALILIAPSPTGYDYTDWPTAEAEDALDELISKADDAGDVEQVNQLEVRYWLDGVNEPEGRVRGAPRELMLDMNERALRAEPVGEPATRIQAWNRLSEITVPTLVVVGEHDLPGVHQQCNDIAELIPQAQSATIAGSAHCPSLDRPEELSNVILRFLDQVGPRSR